MVLKITATHFTVSNTYLELIALAAKEVSVVLSVGGEQITKCLTMIKLNRKVRSLIRPSWLRPSWHRPA